MNGKWQKLFHYIRYIAFIDYEKALDREQKLTMIYYGKMMLYKIYISYLPYNNKYGLVEN